MPTRSLTSSVLKWPDRKTVTEAARLWAARVGERRPEVVRIGYFGSYAGGNWGVGSDLDLVIVVDEADEPFERRAVSWDATRMPVPADVLVYTTNEFDHLDPTRRFYRILREETVWLYVRRSRGTSQEGLQVIDESCDPKRKAF